MPVASQYTVVDITRFGPCLDYWKDADGTWMAGGLYGPDEDANFSVIGLVNYATERMWRLAFQKVMFTSDYDIVYSIENDANLWNSVYPGADGTNTFTWADLAAGQTSGGQPTSYQGLQGSAAVNTLFSGFMKSVTTQQGLIDTTNWRNDVLKAALNSGFDATVNITPIPAASNPTPEIPANPPAQQVGGIPTAAALEIATDPLLTGGFVAPLAGAPVPWRFQVGFGAPSTT